MQPTLRLELPVDPDIRCPHCNGPCVTDTDSWSSHCTSCEWSTDYHDPEDAFLVAGLDVDFLIGLED